MPLMTDNSLFPFIRGGIPLKLQKIVGLGHENGVYIEWDSGDISKEDINMIATMFPISFITFVKKVEELKQQEELNYESKEVNMEEVD